MKPVPFNVRIATVAAHDVLMAAASFELSLLIRYGAQGTAQPIGFLWQGTALFTVICGLVFWRSGLYRGIWHYASINDLLAIVRSVTIALAVFLPVLFVLTRLDAYPRSAAPINWTLLIVMLTVPRFLYRALKDGNFRAVFDRGQSGQVLALVVGAGDAAEGFIREMARSKSSPYRVVGIVDDRPGRVGRDIRGIRVLGPTTDLAAVVALLEKKNKRPHRIILASDSLDGAVVRRIVDEAESLGMTMGRVPRMTDLGDAPMEVRKVAVEDLLGRPQTVLDRTAMKSLIEGRRALITGAGGTIGSELVRQIAGLGPSKLALLENSEINLYTIDQELSEVFPDLPRVAYLGDVRDPKRLEDIFSRERPELIFHAAALKHVPLAEANPNETVMTNVIGTRNVAEAARDVGALAMVLISTDKAVGAAGVMGASKRAAELYCQSLNAQSQGDDGATRFVTVRFGNVLGSTGSVIPLFQRQLAAGGPLTVTDPDATRYFMTVNEAVELVLQASAIPPDEAGADTVFVLDMGEPVRIQDLARQMIRLSGKEPGKDIGIEFTGLRPGEKLTEALFHESENLRATGLNGVLFGTAPTIEYKILVPRIAQLQEAAAANRTDDTQSILSDLVPEFPGGSDANSKAAAS